MKIFNINEVPLPKDRPVLAKLQTSYTLVGKIAWVQVQWHVEYSNFYISFDCCAMSDIETVTHWIELPEDIK